VLKYDAGEVVGDVELGIGLDRRCMDCHEEMQKKGVGVRG